MNKFFEFQDLDYSPAKDSIKVKETADTNTTKKQNLTMLDGNKTSEILGSIDATSLMVGDTLGCGEFGSVLKGIWTTSSGDKVCLFLLTYSKISNN